MKSCFPLVTLAALFFAGVACPQPKVIREVKLGNGRITASFCLWLHAAAVRTARDALALERRAFRFAEMQAAATLLAALASN